jgi:hypothetical protein
MTQEPYIRTGFGENPYNNLTTLHPLGIAVLAVAVVWTITASRDRAWLPILLMACFVSTSQRIVIATLDFNFIRVMIAAAMVRIIARNEQAGMRLTQLDKLVIAWVFVGATVSVLRIGTISSIIYKCGAAYDTLGLYALGRVWLRRGMDLQALSRSIALIACIAVLGYLRENLTGRNIYSIFGGVSEFTGIRDGRLRCQGPFAHPILAGAFWVGFLPMIAIQLRTPRGRLRASFGLLSVLTITVLCSSSTPLLGALATAGFGGLWLLRRHSSSMRWGVAATLVALHMVMTGPVWSLIAKASVVGGSTGYHRYKLVDSFINHWTEWFLLGTNSTAHWGWFLFDVANQYVKEGVQGGLLTLALFIMILIEAFSSIGKQIRSASSRLHAVSMWAVGTAIAAHCVMFIGISITHSNTNMLIFLWLFAATQTKWDQGRKLNSKGNNSRKHLPSVQREEPAIPHSPIIQNQSIVHQAPARPF